MKKVVEGSLIWFIATLFVVYGACLNATAAVLADDIKQSLHLSNPDISLVIGSFIIGFGLMQIPAGYLIDRYNKHFLVCLALFIILIGNILIPHAQHLGLFVFGNFLQGVGSSFAFVATSVLISEWFSANAFPILIGVLETIVTLSVGLAGYTFVLATTHYPWQAIYQGLFIVGLIILILSFLFVKSPSDVVRKKTLSLKKSLTKIFYNPQIWICSLAAGVSFGVLLAYADLWFVPVQKFYLVEHRETALIGSLFYLGIAVGSPFLGWLSNRVHSRKLILHLSLVLGNMTLLLAIYLPHFAIQTLIIVKIISFLTGFLLSGSVLFYTVVKENAPPETQGLALALTNMVVNIFNAIMLLIPYLFLTASSQQFFTYLWVLPFCVLIAILLNYFVKIR